MPQIFPQFTTVGVEWISPPEKVCDPEEVVFDQQVLCCFKPCTPQQTIGMTGVQGQRIRIDLESFPPTSRPSFRTELLLFEPSSSEPILHREDGTQEIDLPVSGEYRFLLRGVVRFGEDALRVVVRRQKHFHLAADHVIAIAGLLEILETGVTLEMTGLGEDLTDSLEDFRVQGLSRCNVQTGF